MTSSTEPGGNGDDASGGGQMSSTSEPSEFDERGESTSDERGESKAVEHAVEHSEMDDRHNSGIKMTEI